MYENNIMEEAYLKATGKIDFNMTNDYMFRVILQQNKTVLRGLVRSLLRLQNEDIESVEVTNPILLGEDIDAKTFILDVNVTLNNNVVINLEMQMQDFGNWTDRALSYLCRNFTQVKKGGDYSEAKPVIHIGFLNFALFPEYPEFYARYQMKNIVSHYLFSSKLMIGVVDLNQIEMATDEDKRYGLDRWVALFKSKTWEELRMIAKENPELLETGKALYQYNNEETIRWQCWAREDYQQQMNSIERRLKEATKKDIVIEELTDVVAIQKELLAEKDEAIAASTETIAEQKELLAEKDEAIAASTETIAEQKELLAEKDEAIAASTETIAEQKELLAEKDEAIAASTETIAEQKELLAEMSAYIKELESQLENK